MSEKKILAELLKYELMQLRKSTETSNDPLPIQLGFPKLLLDMEVELGNNNPNKEKLEKGCYGIFRLVTESYEFEKSDLGQELLLLRLKIKEFASTLTVSE